MSTKTHCRGAQQTAEAENKCSERSKVMWKGNEEMSKRRKKETDLKKINQNTVSDEEENQSRGFFTAKETSREEESGQTPKGTCSQSEQEFQENFRTSKRK